MRNTEEIRKWMIDEKLSVVKIKKALKFKNHGTVSNTLAGRAHNNRILRYLLEKGCPVKYLDLPERMKEAA